MKDAFRAAYDCLDGVYRRGAFASAQITEAFAPGGYEKNQNPLVTKIIYGTLDRDIELSYIIGKFASSVKPAVLTVLKIGVYCIKYLSIPVHAVVNECVNLTKTLGKSGVSGFVNAVLKNISQAVKAGGIIYPENGLESSSVKNSFPLWALKILVADYGMETAEKIASYYPPENFTHVRINTARITPDAFRRLLDEKGIRHELSLFPDAAAVYGSLKGLDGALYTAQSAASMVVARAVGAEKGNRILDVCAAPGGKSVYIASLAENSEVISCDIHPHRVELIKKYAARMGTGNVRAVLNDATVTNEEFLGAFDRVLCDVPCSGFGVLAGKPDIKLFRKESDIDELAALQARILGTSAQYVRPGGSLVYSTCTVFKKENERVVKEFLRGNGNFKTETLETVYGGAADADGFVQFLTYRDNIDGFFIAKLKRIE